MQKQMHDKSSTHPRCGCIKRYPLKEMSPYKICILGPLPLPELHYIFSLQKISLEDMMRRGKRRSSHPSTYVS